VLVISRKEQEEIRIGDDIVIRVVRTGGKTVRIGINAPKSMRILRAELDPAPDQKDQKAA
jgi:carbon storage regulator